MAVYNMLGQRLRVLVHQRQEAGRYTAVWDGTDDHGRRVGNGVYLYRVSVHGQEVVTRKMMMLR